MGRAVTPRTKYQWGRMLVRFAEYRVAHPEGSLIDSVRSFLASLTPANGHTAFLALRAALPDRIPWQSIPHPRARRDEAMLLATLFTAAELVRIRASATHPRDRALLECLWTLRRVEPTRSHWADIDLSAGTMRVIRKGGRVSWTLLRLEAQLALTQWFIAAGQPPDSAWIFPGRAGHALQPRSVSDIVRGILDRAGVYRRWRGAHAFRRTMATAYLQQNPGDLEGLAKLLGHQTISTTFLYDWLQPQELRPRLDRVAL